MKKLKNTLFERSVLNEIRNIVIFFILSIVSIVIAKRFPIQDDVINTFIIIVKTLMAIYALLLFIAIIITFMWNLLEQND